MKYLTSCSLAKKVLHSLKCTKYGSIYCVYRDEAGFSPYIDWVFSFTLMSLQAKDQYQEILKFVQGMDQFLYVLYGWNEMGERLKKERDMGSLSSPLLPSLQARWQKVPR